MLYIFLLAVIATASFDPLLSVDYVTRREKTVEQRLEESVERTEAGNTTRRIVLILLGGVATASLLRRRGNRLGVNGTLGFAIIFFLAWAWLSLLWSFDQPLTLRRLVLLGMLGLGALAAAERFSFHEITVFVFISGCVILVAGLACELALGTFQPLNPEYRFAGTMNPIFQSAHLGTMAIASIALAHTYPKKRAFFFAAAILAVSFMLITRSRGPAAATIIALAVYWSCTSPGFRKIALFSLIPVLILLAIPGENGGLLTNVENAMLFGRKVPIGHEMQGRDALWRESLKFSAKRPMLGYGYDAFWTREFTFAVTDASGFTSQHTHNAFLDLLLGVGLPGALAFILALILSMKTLLIAFRRSRSVHHACALSLLILYAIHNTAVSAQFFVQFQTFVVLAIIAKLGFIRPSPDRAFAETIADPVRIAAGRRRIQESTG